MRALTLFEGRLEMTEIPPIAAPGGEAIVAVRVVGVCDTDLELAKGYMGFSGVPGHEFVGDVIGCDDAAWIGRRVIGDINAGCGHCDDCRRRDGHHCEARTVLGIVGRSGAFAEQLALPTRCLIDVPASVPDDIAVFAEPVAAALHVLDDAPRIGDAPILVLGDGKLGLLIALSLHADARRVVLVGHHRDKLAIAKQAGIEVLLESELDLKTKFDVVVEATGHPSGIASAIVHTKPRGSIIQKTTVAGPVAIDLSRIVVDEIRLVGSRCGDMKRAVDLLARGDLDPRPLIAERFSLNDSPRAFERAATKGVLKVLVDVATAD